MTTAPRVVDVHPPSPTFEASLLGLRTHDHLCLIYESDDERTRALVPFLREGLVRRERCLYIVDGGKAAAVVDQLDRFGTDVAGALQSGQLRILSTREAYLRQGSFDPDRMIALLDESVREAKADGWTGLRVTGEMTWALAGRPGSERLLEYEAKLNRFFPTADVIAICQYDRRWFDPKLIKGVIATHPLVIHGDHVCRNFYYVPPDEFLAPHAADREVDRLLLQIRQRAEQEEQLEQRERTLREQARVLDAFFTHSLTPLVFLDPQFGFMKVNAAYATATARPIEEFAGRNHFDLYPSDAREAFEEVVRTRRPFSVEARPFRYADHPEWGITYWDWSLVPILDDRGEVDFLVLSLNDVTARTRAEEALAREAALVRMLQATSSAANQADTLDAAMQTALDAVCRETEWRVGHAFSCGGEGAVATSSELWSGAEAFAALRAASEGLQIPRGVGLVGNVLETGSPQWVSGAAQALVPGRREAADALGLASWAAFPVRAGSEMVAILEFFSPGHVEPDERMLDAMAHVGIQLGRVAERQRADERLARYARELERSNADLGEFASVASHDLQEPLRKIVAFGDRLAERAADALDDTSRDFLRRMQSSAGRLSELIDRLLELSRVNTRGRPPEPTSLTAAVVDAISDLELKVRETGATVEAGSLPEVRADPAQMRQLFMNLLSNALKFQPPGQVPMVQIVGRTLPDGGCEVTVADNGVGFDERYAQRIFRPFQRLHPRDAFAGAGMGLAICRKIVERHGGRLTATSAPGQGARFTLWLPGGGGRAGP